MPIVMCFSEPGMPRSRSWISAVGPSTEISTFKGRAATNLSETCALANADPFVITPKSIDSSWQNSRRSKNPFFTNGSPPTNWIV